MRIPHAESTLRNGCKINLYLRVAEKLPNGYHVLDSLLVPIAEPHDQLLIVPLASRRQGVIRASFSSAQGDALADIDPARNTLTRAYFWYAEQTGFAPPLKIRACKGIPRGAGLGGGSANAAALLAWLQHAAEQAGAAPLEQKKLIKESVAIGADVPFFLGGTTAAIQGVGETLLPARNPFGGFFLLLLCPGLIVSTAWAFAALDAWRKEHALTEAGNSVPDATGLTSARPQATTALAYARENGNDFEHVVFQRFPELTALYGRLLATGAERVRMSGTGSSLFALYREEKNAISALKALANSGLNVYMQRLSVDGYP